MKKKLLMILPLAVGLSILMTGCGSDNKAGDDKKISIAASATPHAEILEFVKPKLAEKGYDLDIQVYNDYVQPNKAVDSGEKDANYFQHITYLNNFNKEEGTKLENAGDIHYEPFGIYPGKKSDLKEIAEGDDIALPNDVTNEARALLLLQDAGLIKLKDDAGINATIADIAENPYKLKFNEMEAAQIPNVKDEVAFVCLNGNYALSAGLKVNKDALVYEKEDSKAAQAYMNVIAVKEGDKDKPKIKALVEELKSPETKKFIEEKYEGQVIAAQ